MLDPDIFRDKVVLEVNTLFLTQDEVAQELGVARSTVAAWLKSGYLPSVVWGGRRRIPREALERFKKQLVERALEQSCVR